MSERIHIKKQDFLIRPGESNGGTFLVRKGVLRTFKVDAKGKEHILLFAAEGWIIGDIESQIKGQSSGVYVQAIEDAEVHRFEPPSSEDTGSPDENHEVFGEGHHGRLLRRIVTLEDRVMMLLSHSALERYESFLASYPDLVNRIPQWMIASYIGVTPEALSKARRSRVQGGFS